MGSPDLSTPPTPVVDAGSGGTSAGSSSPFIDTAGGIHAFLTFDYSLQQSQIASAAPHNDFIWGATASYVPAWHQANPKMVLSYYIPFDQDGTGCDINCWKASHPDWLVYQCDKTTVSSVSGYAALDLDFTNPAVQAWQQQQVQKAASQGYDGIAWDLFALFNNRGKCGVFRNGQWVQLWNGTSSDSKYTQDVLSWQQNTYAAMHAMSKPMLFIPNYTLDRSPTDPAITQFTAHTDAVLDEAYAANWGYYTTDSDWVNRVTFARNLQSLGKAYYAINGYSTVDSAAMNWSIASYLMAKEHAAGIWTGGSTGNGYGTDQWHPEYGAAIGAACGEMSAQQNAYARTFAHGMAIANPSSSATVSFTLPAGSFTDLQGNAVSGTVSLPPHSGTVLLKSGSAPSC